MGYGLNFKNESQNKDSRRDSLKVRKIIKRDGIKRGFYWSPDWRLESYPKSCGKGREQGRLQAN